MLTTHNFSFPSTHQNSTLTSLTCKMLYSRSLLGWLQTFLLSTLLKLSFFIGLKQQLSKIHNFSLTTTHSSRNLGFIFDEHLTFSALSKSCYYHIRELRCRPIRPYLDFKTAAPLPPPLSILYLITVTRTDSLYHNLPNHQLNRLQHRSSVATDPELSYSCCC